MPTIEHKVAKGCTNATCKFRPSHPDQKIDFSFCPLCGTSIGVITIEVEVRTSPYDILPSERLTPLGAWRDKVCLGTNVKAPRLFHINLSEEQHFSLLTHSAQAEMDWFCNQFPTEIEAVRKAYRDVRVDWGLHIY